MGPSSVRRAVLVTGAIAGVAFAVVSCVRARPPQVAASASLNTGDRGGGPRKQGPFAVVYAGPRGAVTPKDQGSVTVLFNRSMRTFESADTAGVPTLSIRTEQGQAIAGTWRFVGTHGVLFTPKAPLPGSTRFSVTVPAATRALGGEALQSDYTFTFFTAPPEVLATAPADGAADLRADSVLRLEYNQRMDPEAVAGKARLWVKSRPGDEPRSIAVRGSRPKPPQPPLTGTFEHVVLLSPAEPLPLDSEVQLVVAPGLSGADGPLATKAPYTLTARTYGPLRMADFRCPRITPGRCQAHRDVTVVLSNDVAPAEFRAHFEAPALPRQSKSAQKAANDESPTAKAARAEASKPRREHLLGVDPEMGKRYRVTLKKGMRDVFGQVLERDVAFDIDTEAPFVTANGKRVIDPSKLARGATTRETSTASDEEAESERAAAAAEAAEKADPRPRRPVLSYELALGLQGHVVEAVGKDGARPHVVPIGAVNVPTYGMIATKMRPEDAIAWLGAPPSGLPDAQRWTWVSPGAPENTRSVRSVDLDAILGGPAGRGGALLAVTWPGNPHARKAELVTVTDIGVSAAMSTYGSLVWVTRLSTGQPISGATVSVQRAAAKSEVFRGSTDAEGLVVIPKQAFDPVKHGRVDRDAFLFASAGEDWTYQRIERAVASQRSPVAVDLQQRGAWSGMLYADRGVYRPGETLKLAGVFRKFDAAGMKTPLGAEARIELTDSQGERVFDGRAKLDAFGGIALDVTLPRTTHLGDASIAASVGPANGPSFYTSILLAEYKASEFKVAVDPAKSEYVRGDEASFDVRAEYLFGAPMGNVPMHTTASRSVASFVPPGADAFAVTDEAGVVDRVETNPRAEELSENDDTLDDGGAGRRTLPLDLPRMAGPEQVTLEAEVRDLTNQTVARRATVLVHPAAFYLGIGRLERRFLAVGADVSAAVVALEPSGKHVPGVAAKVDLILRTWVGVVEDQAAEVARQRSTVKDEIVGTCNLVSSASVAACKLKVQKPGYYLLRATAVDARKNAVGSSTSFYAVDDRADEASATVAFRSPDARGVELEVDKKQYEPGENARILVRNPFREADALVTVQRGGVLWHKVVPLKGPMPVVEVPVRSEYFPNVYVSVHLVRGRIKAAPPGGVDLGAPDFRVGTTQLRVDPDAHRLGVRIAPARDEYRPGEAVDADVTVTGADGRPARASLTFYAVDEGVLMLTGYKTPDPLPAFASERSLAVFGLESRESLARILSMKNGQKVARLGFDFLSLPDADKGFEGGGGGEDAVRADFRTTAFFEAGHVTSNEGKARFHFKLPDNLTTFRLMAVASAEDDRFGFGESRVTTNRKLMARPALPRLVRQGDEFQAGVIVSSRDLPDGAVDVRLRAKGLVASGAASQRVQLGRGKSVEVRFPVKATASGPASLEFDVRGSGHEDRVLVKRTVELPVSHETVAVYGETTSAAAVSLGDLRSVRPDTGGLDVHLASTALVGIGETFEHNLEYPYGCTEQLVSRALPLLVLSDLGRDFHARLPAKIDDVIDGAVGEILSHQTGYGGFGYWDEGTDVPWLSAFTMLALETAAEKKYFVPKAARDQGIAYLQGVLARARYSDAATPEEEPVPPPPSEDEIPDEDKPAREYADATFAADVLATVGQSQPGTLNLLFDARHDKPLFTQALLLHAMAVAKLPRSTLDVLAREVTSRVRVGAGDAFVDEQRSGYDAWLDSPVRTTALVLRALLAVDPRHPLASGLARGLLSRRERGAWRSTQENTWALLALGEYRKVQESAPPNFEAQVFLGDDLIGNAGFRGRAAVDAPFSVSAARVARSPGPLSFSVIGDGKLFYAAELRYASSALPARPDDAGFSVQRLVRALKPKDLAAAQASMPESTQSTATVNDLIMIDVLFETAEPREQIVLDDPLPAGLEPIDFALDTSSQQQQVNEQAVADAQRARGLTGYGAFRTAYGVHREMHDDRVLTFVSHVDPGIYHFRYLARATTPGRYVVPPLRAEAMYAPEINGRTGATTFEVVPAKSVLAQAGVRPGVLAVASRR